MSYRPSPPLLHWFGARHAALATVRGAHAAAGRVPDAARPLAQAYAVRVVAEFQGYVRDLHDLAAAGLILAASSHPRALPYLLGAAVHGRALDRGNATLRSIDADFTRIGIGRITARTSAVPPYHTARWDRRRDQARYGELLALRNSLAHGNQKELDRLRAAGVLDTLTWTRQRIPALDRTARALDRVVWDHLHDVYQGEPW